MRVFPHVVGIDDQMLADRLSEPGMKIVALAGRNRARSSENAGEDALWIPVTRNNQVFIEGSFKDTGVGNPKNRICALDVVGDARARFRLAAAGDAAINVAANTDVEGPVALRDRVLNVEGHLFDVRVAMKMERTSSLRQVERARRVGRIRAGPRAKECR